MTRETFTRGRVTRSSASRKYARTGRPGIAQTVVEALIALFDQSDIRELVGYMYPETHKPLTKDARIFCGTLLMAMPLFRYFKDGPTTPRTRPFTSKYTMMSIFRGNPERAAALIDLERRPVKMWRDQNWKKLALDGRVFIRESVPFTKRMKRDTFLNIISSGRKCTNSELLIWIDMPGDLYSFPVMMSVTSAAMLHLLFVQKRVAVEIVLDSEYNSECPPGSHIGSLDLSMQPLEAENRIVLSCAELLTYDLLLWILDRPPILGKMDVLTVVARGNYSAAVRNLTSTHFGYNLGRAFVELTDMAMCGNTHDVLSISIEPKYNPAREMGISERCAELEIAAYQASTAESGDTNDDLLWPPALPFERPSTDVSINDIISVMNTYPVASEGIATFMLDQQSDSV